MKYKFIYLYLFFSININNSFLVIINSYIRKYNKIENNCEAKPFYKIYFVKQNKYIGFWIGTHLGIPSPIKPNKQDTMEIKGVLNIGINKIVVYDYIDSFGYGLYDTAQLSKFEISDFDNLPDDCVNVLYPEAIFYMVTKDSIFITDKRPSFKLK